MKSFVAILLLVGIGTLSKAQDTARFVEIGLNATPFVRQYLNFGADSILDINPYVLTAEQKRGKYGIRVGLGLLSANDLELANEDNTEPAFKTNELTLALRAGLVAYKNLSKRFSLKYGTDLYFQYNLTRSETSTTGLFDDVQTVVISSFTYETGLSPFLFVQYHITPQFSIGTEALGKIGFVSSVSKVENSQFPDFNDRDESIGTRFGLSAPTALFLILRF
jgi:hypothetical protein